MFVSDDSDPEVTIQEQNFHNAVREHIVSTENIIYCCLSTCLQLQCFVVHLKLCKQTA